jgi:hypothetical protein
MKKTVVVTSAAGYISGPIVLALLDGEPYVKIES